MTSGIDFQQLRKKAAQKGYLQATPGGLDTLDQWLHDQGHDNAKAREYIAERIHLVDSGQAHEPFTARLLDYLTAYGTRLIRNSANADLGAREAHLHQLVALIRDASREVTSPFNIPLYGLLVDALTTQGMAATQARNPYQIVNEDSLRKAAPEKSLLEIGKASELCVIGDLHGDASTARLIANWLMAKFGKSGTETPVRAVFLGDYINNGLQSIAVLEQVLTLKQEFPDHVTLLSGNHEFGETYATALTELLGTHWNQWQDFSGSLTPDWKTPPAHYGHLRLDLAMRYGAEAGEAVHRKFELWGRSLPLCALHEGTFMCHSIGLGNLERGTLRAALNGAKRDPDDIRKLANEGYEAWKKDTAGRSLHAAMVNNRDITAATLEALRRAVGAELFLIGHSHYRSGDRDVVDGPSLRRATRHEQGRLATLCSSHPRSNDAGHYIAREFEQTRKAKLDLSSKTPEPWRTCIAAACVVILKGSPTCLWPGDLVPLHEL